MPEATVWVEFRTHAHIPASRGSKTLCERPVFAKDPRTEKPTLPKCGECIRLAALAESREERS